jgi:type IV secretion system protein VirB4
VLRGFTDRTDRLLRLVEAFMPECRWLDDGETLTYLHGCVSTHRHRVRVPETPMYLDALLADQPLTGGLEPRLGRRICASSPSPVSDRDDARPARRAEPAGLPLSLVTRAILLDKTDATKLLTKIRRQWFAKRKSIAAILKEVMTNEASVLVDTDASNKAADADLALQELGADYAGIAYVTATVTVWDAIRASPTRSCGWSRRSSRAATSPRWPRPSTRWTPGSELARPCLRQCPAAADLHAQSRPHDPPGGVGGAGTGRAFRSAPAAVRQDRRLDPVPVFPCRRCRPHADRRPDRRGQVGAAGADGLAVPALCRAQVFAFDFGGSIRAAALAMGGDWHDLGGDLTEGARPSASAARPHRRRPERAWAADWIVAILRAKASPSPRGEGAHLDGADLAGLGAGRGTHHHRPCVLLQSNDLKQALRPIASAAPMGGCSTPRRTSRHGDGAGVRDRGLIGTGAAPAVLAYLFHRIEDRSTDRRPSHHRRGWLALDDEGFAGQLREWLKTLRKKNASVIFATQSLSDIDGSAIAPAIIESCQTRLLLPNERAIEPQITAIYRRFGLNDRQIEIIARAMPKRDYYCQSRRGNRLFELGLSDVALALCAASSKTDQPRSRGCRRARRGRLPRRLAAPSRLGWAADLIPTLTLKEKLP